MNSAVEGLRANMERLGVGGIVQTGSRECERCGNQVPIMERRDREGNTHEESMCLNCQTDQTRSRFPKREDLKKEKAKGFSLKYEQVPEKLIGKTVSEYKAETESEKDMCMAVAELIRDFGETVHHSLVLKGPMGLGKSHLAYAAGAELRRQGYSTMFISSDDFLNLIKSTYNKETDLSERTIFDMIEEIDLLIFDEIGAEYINKKDNFETWASEKIYKVTDLRENKPTIFTTNYAAEDMEAKYGPVQGGRIISRMMAGAKRMVVEGRDRRTQDF
ncbi:ATP-binding protein [Thalassobacillus sp. CUG 92003]|uniref:ATP-binding protein n=1 Tax=Thalassobacillus sp. CUG 92003 TaxID=2736641 RepID=UPI0015E6EB3F|nr:ATP-binding protein [Thalassobacillus sp. CUG 92003]